jgi:dihydroorotate dehydrogenase
VSFPYALAAPLLRALDPEAAHRLTLQALGLGLGPRAKTPDPPTLAQAVFGLTFSNPLGLAAGFDKDAEAADAMLGLGLGFVEAGTVTPRPQSGNPRPRLFRLTQDAAVINRMGFNNRGYDAACARLIARRARPGIVGINIGANKDSGEPVQDYCTGLERFGPYAAYITVNISSPNTPGMRGLQAKAPLEKLLSALADTRARLTLKRPILLKIAPDLDDDALADIVTLALQYGLDGLIVSNTTVTRPGTLKSVHARETGGLSGAPLMTMATAMLAKTARLAGGRLILIGAGGVGSGADAYAKIKAGASLVQLYTALVYQGPALVPRIKAELAALLAADGFASVSEAVGKGLS